MHPFVIALLLGLMFAMMACAAETHATPNPASASLRVMTFNLRYANSHDGPNAWPHRTSAVLNVIATFGPDLLGCQEALASQVDFLHDHLPEYAPLGVGRNDGVRGGEFALVLYKTARFIRIDDGHFWLSQTPDKPGKGWDAASIRIVTWAKLTDRCSGITFLFLNTHWDDQGASARLHSAQQIRAWLDQHAARMPVLLTGDFNTFENTQPLRVLLAPGADRPLLDAYRIVHPVPLPDEASFHGFLGATTGQRIDFILHTADFVPTQAGIHQEKCSDAALYPSDHFPVTTLLTLRPS